MTELDIGPPVSFIEVLDAHAENQREGLHTAMPAQVMSYDSATRTCVVQPTVRVPTFNDDGSLDVLYDLPPIPDVPVAFFRGGGFFFAWDLVAGDTVFLVFSETAMGQWRSSGGITDPIDCARHSLGYPVAFPCVSPDTMPFVDGVSGAMVLGKEGDTAAKVIIKPGEVDIGTNAKITPANIQMGGTTPVALAPGVDAALNLIVSGGFTAVATACNALAAAPLTGTSLGNLITTVAGALTASLAAAEVPIAATVLQGL